METEPVTAEQQQGTTEAVAEVEWCRPSSTSSRGPEAGTPASSSPSTTHPSCLVIEALDESDSCGLPALSVAHYGEQNGDNMRDPEMRFELSFAGGVADLNRFYCRQDYVGSEQWSRFITGTDYAYSRELHRQHVSFAKVWDRNLRSQGFVETFEHLRRQAA